MVALSGTGCTVTAAILTGWLLTIANTGDSGAFLDTGNSVLEATEDHRVADNARERARLLAAGEWGVPGSVVRGALAFVVVCRRHKALLLDVVPVQWLQCVCKARC